jgi:hypothetical protein
MKKTKIYWENRYSQTMENDQFDRWARVAWAGKLNALGFWKHKVCRWQIAWIEKRVFKDEHFFFISYFFPSNGSFKTQTLDEAKIEVEKSFDWFIKMVTANSNLKKAGRKNLIIKKE